MTVQVNVRLALRSPSETVAVTAWVPALADDKVPEMSPVDALILRLAGSPVAL